MSIVNTLNAKLDKTLEHKLFRMIVGAIIFMNPLATAPQVWSAFTAPNVSGLSLPMWYIFATIQTAMTFEGIRTKSAPMFWSMLASVLQSTTIIIVVLARR